MKKMTFWEFVVLACVCVLMFLMVKPAFAHQASDEDLARWQEEVQRCIDAGDAQGAARWAGFRACYSVPTPATYDDLRGIVTAACAQHIKDEAKVAALVDDILVWECVYGFDRKFGREGYALAVARKDATRLYLYASIYRQQLEISDAQLYGLAIEALKKGELDSANTREALVLVPGIKPEAVEDSALLKDLRKINQIYTAKMLTDEEKWKPIVVVIRTMMDSYR